MSLIPEQSSYPMVIGGIRDSRCRNLESMRTGKTATRVVSTAVLHKNATEAVRKALRGLSEDVRVVLTVNTEFGEIACVLHTHILGTTMSSWSLVRANILL